MGEVKNINDQLIEAAESGDLDTVRRLVEAGADISHSAFPCFLRAFCKGHFDIVDYLLAQGADINFNQFDEGTMLNLAAFDGHIEKINFLLDRGADINAGMPGGGEGPLHNAADKDHPTVVRLLIDRGAEVNAPATNSASALIFGPFAGETPLHVAAVNSGAALICILLDAGADKTTQTAHGKTPLDYAVDHERPVGIIQLLED